MANATVDLWQSFQTVALVFLGGGLVASVGAGTFLPFAIAAAVCILVKVFCSWEI